MVSPSVENMSMSLDVHKSILKTEKTLKTFTSGLGFFLKTRVFSNPALWPMAQLAWSLRPAPTATGLMIYVTLRKK